jgi:dCMP deaminase
VLQSGISRVVYQEAYKDPAGIDFLKNAGVQVLNIVHIDD